MALGEEVIGEGLLQVKGLGQQAHVQKDGLHIFPANGIAVTGLINLPELDGFRQDLALNRFISIGQVLHIGQTDLIGFVRVGGSINNTLSECSDEGL